ncbi:hypothetical protein DFH06DRAFT_1325183 [Mycena polygramma]|nr:hypothetical protein DFH06DRAFT_1325183 [Mycena polygramma]
MIRTETNAGPRYATEEWSADTDLDGPGHSLWKRGKKLPAATIAGGTVAGVAAVLALLSIFLLWRSAPHRRRARAERRDAKPDGVAAPAFRSPDFPDFGPPEEQDATTLAAQVRRLQEQVKRLESERSEGGGSTVGSDTASVARSMSTMKRDQMWSIHQSRYTESDELSHTDSGLRLTAGRTVHAPPPMYVAQ